MWRVLNSPCLWGFSVNVCINVQRCNRRACVSWCSSWSWRHRSQLGQVEWGACSIYVRHYLPLLTALFLLFPPPNPPRRPRWRLRSCSSVSTDGLSASSRSHHPLVLRLTPFVFSGRAIQTQITKTRMWGTGIPTRSQNRHVSTLAPSFHKDSGTKHF